MEEELSTADVINEDAKKLAEFLENDSPQKIKNRLTDYSEVITEGKLSGIINYNYQLTSNQVNEVIDILIGIGAVSRIHNLALKGARDLENEYISNIFSDYLTPQNISSYISLRTTLENRLNHQIQQYNMNMIKSNTSSAMSVNELKGHVRTFKELSQSSISISTKAQHGVIAASLHDAYVTILNRNDWRNDRTYMKYFFNEEDTTASETLILTRETRRTLKEINQNFDTLIEEFSAIKSVRMGLSKPSPQAEPEQGGIEIQAATPSAKKFSDRMLQTPFGKQYGTKIDEILKDVFSPGDNSIDPGQFHHAFLNQFDNFTNFPDLLGLPQNKSELILAARFLIVSDLSLKSAAERFLLGNNRDPYRKTYTGDEKELVNSYYNSIYENFFNDMFLPIFKIIRSLDMKTYACAYIVKRIYFLYGESLNGFGYYFLKTIARVGGIRSEGI